VSMSCTLPTLQAIQSSITSSSPPWSLREPSFETNALRAISLETLIAP
jgi:hypothetical protein